MKEKIFLSLGIFVVACGVIGLAMILSLPGSFTLPSALFLAAHSLLIIAGLSIIAINKINHT